MGKKLKIPEMNIKKIKMFWITSIGILAGTVLFNLLGLIDGMLQFVSGMFLIMAWFDIVVAILVTFKFANREDNAHLIMGNYFLCLLLALIVPLMGINTLLLGLMSPTGFGNFFLLQVEQVLWTYVTLGCSLGFVVCAFIATRKNESIWKV